jgi:hypothetical protein
MSIPWPSLLLLLLAPLLHLDAARTVYPWQQTMTGNACFLSPNSHLHPTSAIRLPLPQTLNPFSGTCWTDATCNRSLVVSHGGDWNLDAPYEASSRFCMDFV